MNKDLHLSLYKLISDILEKSPMSRSDLLQKVCEKRGFVPSNLDVGSSNCSARSDVGNALNDMLASNLIKIDKKGFYYLCFTRPVIIRIERCEKEIIKALTEKPYSKKELKDHLEKIFGADKTSSRKDDDIISSYLGQLTKKLIKYGAIKYENDMFLLSEKVSANADNVNELMALKADFIAKLHSKGGEFFEHYFMSLLSKYNEAEGKKILECYVTGGSADGGIDGVMKTEDSLGFREITLVQTKNKLEIATETDVRGFYGAFCAKRGTRGIYAISSDFHPSAEKFLSNLDDCIGVNGDIIFKMAMKCLFGIKRKNKKYVVDTKIFS